MIDSLNREYQKRSKIHKVIAFGLCGSVSLNTWHMLRRLWPSLPLAAAS